MTGPSTEDRVRAALTHRTAETRTTPPTLDQLYAIAAHPDPVRAGHTGSGGRPARWAVGATAAAAVAALAVGGAAYVTHRSHDSGATSVAASSLDSGQRYDDTAAPALLIRIADTVERTEPTAPRADQWIYTRTTSADVQASGQGFGVPTVQLDTTTTREAWAPQDGSSRPAFRVFGSTDLQRVTLPTYADGTPAVDPAETVTYAQLTALPDDDFAGLLATLEPNAQKQAGKSEAEAAINIIAEKVGGELLPPGVAGEIYRGLAALPGITAQDGVTDLLGRPAIAIGATDAAGERHELLFDPDTLRPLGDRSFVVTSGSRGTAGAPTGSTAYVLTGVVDQAGQTPAGG